ARKVDNIEVKKWVNIEIEKVDNIKVGNNREVGNIEMGKVSNIEVNNIEMRKVNNKSEKVYKVDNIEMEEMEMGEVSNIEMGEVDNIEMGKVNNIEVDNNREMGNIKTEKVDNRSGKKMGEVGNIEMGEVGNIEIEELNKYDFIITILEPNTQNLSGPRYQVTCGLKSSEICTSSSMAITSLYQQIFNTKTKFSGLLVMGFDQQDIVNQMLENIQFRPFEFFIEKLRIIIIEIVWIKIDNKPKYNANSLFGLENIYTQELIRQLKVPSCTLEEWNDESILQEIFKYHFKKQMKSNINWMEFIRLWKNQKSEIIELQSSLKQLYGSEYQINLCELCAWKSMLRHMGCKEITPYDKNQSE
ncbi:6041_t:CDS:2, partial [Diversispora eburnea]